MIKNLLVDLLGRRKDNFDWRSTMPTLELEKVESVCVLHHNEKTGDAVLISLLVDALAAAHPGIRIFVGAPSSFLSYWGSHGAVAEVAPFDIRRGPYPLRIAKAWRLGRAWRGRFHTVVSFQPFARPELFALLRGLKPRTAIGFNKDQYRLFDYSLEEHRHGVDLAMIADRTRSVMKLFGHDVEVEALRPHLPFGPSDEAIVREMLFETVAGRSKALVNVYGAGSEKRITPASLRRLIEEMRRARYEGTIVVSVPQGAEREYAAALGEERLRDIRFIGPQKGLASLFALISAVDLVVSPDTAVGHIAAAFQKPQVCLFARRGAVPVIWRPLNERCTTLVPASGNDVNGIDWDEFGRAMRNALSFVVTGSETETSGAGVRR